MALSSGARAGSPKLAHDQPDRRTLLTRAVALSGLGALAGCASERAAVASSLAPLRARASVPLAEGETLRIAVLGTGGMGTAHCEAIASLARSGAEKVQITALADVADPRSHDAAAKLEAQQGLRPRTYRDHRELLEKEDVHGVLIASPEHWHAPMAIDAIRAGKDVYVEKPMTYDLDAALGLVDAARASDRIVQVGTQYVMLPKYAEAKRLMAAGAIGKPVSSQTSYCRNSKIGEWNYYEIDERVQPGTTLDWDRWCGPLGSQTWDPLVYWRWRRYKKYSSGIIGDLLVHQMTPLISALDVGWPTRVIASGGHYVDEAMENFDQVNLTIEFEGEHTMVVAGSTCNETGLETLIRGHEANLFLGGNASVVVRPESLFADEIEEQAIECPVVSEHDALRLNWLSCIRTRKAPASPVELGMKIMVIVDLATRSMWEGKAFGFDPVSRRAYAI